jgi:hypothetical protein
MPDQFDIMRFDETGAPIWVESAYSVAAAKMRIAELVAEENDDCLIYFIYSHATGERITVIAKRAEHKPSTGSSPSA